MGGERTVGPTRVAEHGKGGENANCMVGIVLGRSTKAVRIAVDCRCQLLRKL